MKADMKKNQRQTPSGNYELSRFNATRHGILSKHTLLPWEIREEYEELHLSLRQEYAPVGPTQEHLVEEIAGIFWRKRRLRMAETAAFRNKVSRLRNANGNLGESDDFVEWRFPNIADQLLQEIFNMNSEDWARSLTSAKTNKICTQKALKIFKADGSQAYQQALETLPLSFQQDWEEGLAEGKYSSTPEDFGNFIVTANNFGKQFVDFIYEKSSNMAEAHGLTFDPERLEKLSRYEVFLDRKLERTLAMLLKLQALRRAREPAIE